LPSCWHAPGPWHRHPMSPNKPWPSTPKGKSRYDAGDFSGARAKFEEAIAMEPANPRWHYNLGLAYRQLNNFPAAQQSFLKSLALDPNYKRAEIEDKSWRAWVLIQPAAPWQVTPEWVSLNPLPFWRVPAGVSGCWFAGFEPSATALRSWLPQRGIDRQGNGAYGESGKPTGTG
jgi:tetratricopeptide (TPR) repeat protein